MKTIAQIEKEIPWADVMTTEEFADAVNSGCFIPYDGNGYFHDGENETRLSVWDDELTPEEIEKYPYVCWYNK